MKHTNLLTLLIVPSIIAGIMGAFMYVLFTKHGVDIYSHDVLADKRAFMLLPFIGVTSFFLGYVPAFCYLSSLLYGQSPVTEAGIEEITAIATTTAPSLYVGQVISQAGTNCGLRVKAIKETLQDQYGLQYSF